MGSNRRATGLRSVSEKVVGRKCTGPNLPRAQERTRDRLGTVAASRSQGIAAFRSVPAAFPTAPVAWRTAPVEVVTDRYHQRAATLVGKFQRRRPGHDANAAAWLAARASRARRGEASRSARPAARGLPSRAAAGSLGVATPPPRGAEGSSDQRDGLARFAAEAGEPVLEWGQRLPSLGAELADKLVVWCACQRPASDEVDERPVKPH
jgi:hypothetical protein